MRKIQVGAIVGEVVRLFADWPFLVRVLPVPFAFVLGAEALMLWFSSFYSVQPLWLLVTLVLVLLEGIAVAMLAVRTHRFILLREMPGTTATGDLEWRYLWRAFVLNLPVIFLAVIVDAVAAGLAYSITRHLSVAAVVSWEILDWLIDAVLIGLIVMPAALSLPALAIGRQDFSMRDSREILRGSRRSLILLALFVWLVPGVVSLPLLFMPNAVNAAGIIFHAFLVSVDVSIGAVAFAASLSLLYADQAGTGGLPAL